MVIREGKGTGVEKWEKEWVQKKGGRSDRRARRGRLGKRAERRVRKKDFDGNRVSRE